MLLKKNRVKNLLLLLVTLIFCMIVMEIGMRVFLKDRLYVIKDERNLTYKHDSLLGWFPIANSKNSYKGSRSVNVEHNSRGFRDHEHLIDTKQRIVFLGDSFVWGYDVEKSERFTEKLLIALSNYSIYNLGVSGYGTDQEYLLLKQNYDFYMPDIVFLLFCTENDEEDNSRNERYGGYYKPYFVIDGSNLELKGTPVPKSENYFFANHDILAQLYWFRLFAKLYFKFTRPPYLKLGNPTHAIIANIHEFVKSRGAQFIVGLQKPSAELELFLTDKNIPYLNLYNSHVYPDNGRHWTPEGHTFVSKKIYRFLQEGNYLKMGTVPNKAK
ncbi:MAG: hypothetical protein ACYSTS_08585 [Planctomycetota bacterium]|jgi:hypothetical protein